VGETDQLAVAFQRERHRLTSIAYRMLGSVADAEDTVQGTWLRLDRADPGTIDNLGATEPPPSLWPSRHATSHRHPP
jgi:DNA-directed RNA polymerase specialized sigma24 family protein